MTVACAQCGRSDGELKAYFVTTPHGKRVKRILHPNDCLTRYTQIYTRWFNEKVDGERQASKERS